MAEQVERIKEVEALIINTDGVYMPSWEITEIIRELKDILIQYIVNRERFMTHRRIRNILFSDRYRWKIHADGITEITEFIIAEKEAIGNFTTEYTV